MSNKTIFIDIEAIDSSSANVINHEVVGLLQNLYLKEFPRLTSNCDKTNICHKDFVSPKNINIDKYSAEIPSHLIRDYNEYTEKIKINNNKISAGILDLITSIYHAIRTKVLLILNGRELKLILPEKAFSIDIYHIIHEVCESLKVNKELIKVEASVNTNDRYRYLSA